MQESNYLLHMKRKNIKRIVSSRKPFVHGTGKHKPNKRKKPIIQKSTEKRKEKELVEKLFGQSTFGPRVKKENRWLMDFLWRYARFLPFARNLLHGEPTKEDTFACLRFLKKFREKFGKNKTARLGNTEYESGIGVHAYFEGKKIGRIKTNFVVEGNKRVLYIDAIQGRKPMLFRKKYFKELGQKFEQKYKLKWPNLLIQQAVETAKKADFSEVKLIKPQANPFYEEASEKVQKRMKKFYYSVAGKEGFKKTKGKYMVKKLD